MIENMENCGQILNESKVVERDLSQINVSEPKSMIDVSGYEGMRFKIDSVRELEVIDWFTGPKDASGKPSYNPNSTEKKHVIEIETEPLPKLDENNKPLNELVEFDEGKKLTVKCRFNLKKVVVDGKVDWEISKHARASLWKFMRKMGVETKGVQALKGLYVTLTTEASNNPDDDRRFLKIVM